MKLNALCAVVVFSFSWLMPIRALAEPVTLVCARGDSPNDSWTFPLDEAAKTANGNPARFTDQEITWHDPNYNADYTLNRASGILQITRSYGTVNETCHAGQKQF